MISLIVALYNEEPRIPRMHGTLVDFLEGLGEPWELILVDDGSTDGTLSALRRIATQDARVRVFSLASNLGQGAALKVGVLASRGAWVLYTDADLPVPLSFARELLERVKAGADVVVATRWHPRARITVAQPGPRRWLGRIYYRLLGLILLDGVSDTNCGLKAYRGEAARLMFGMVRCWRWAFNAEALWLARRLGLSVEEVPVEWGHHDGSKVRLYRDIVFTVWELALIKLRHWAGGYPRLKAP